MTSHELPRREPEYEFETCYNERARMAWPCSLDRPESGKRRGARDARDVLDALER